MNMDGILNVTIKAQAVVSSATSYGHMLIVCPAPRAPGSATTPDVGSYSDVSELVTAGFGSDDEGYAAMAVAKSQKQPPDIVYIAIRKNLVEGVEDIKETLQRALDYSGDWWCICPVGMDDDTLKEIAAWVEELGIKFMLGQSTGISSIPITQLYDRAAVLHVTQTSDYYNVRLAAVCLNYEPGSETWDYKTVSGMAGQTLTEADISAMQKLNVGYYVEQFGVCVSLGVKSLSGEWIDVIRFVDWLRDHIQRKVFEMLVVNPKVPYNDGGISQVQSCVISALEDGRTAGGINDDTTDDDGEVVKGYTVTVPRASSLTAAQRKSRSLPGVQFEAQLSGAIHALTIRGTVLY